MVVEFRFKFIFYILFLILLITPFKSKAASSVYLSFDLNELNSKIRNEDRETLNKIVNKFDELATLYEQEHSNYYVYSIISFDYFSYIEKGYIDDLYVSYFRILRTDVDSGSNRLFITTPSNTTSNFQTFGNFNGVNYYLALSDTNDATLDSIHPGFGTFNNFLGKNFISLNGTPGISSSTDSYFYYPLYSNRVLKYNNTSYSSSRAVTLNTTCDDVVTSSDGYTSIIDFPTVDSCVNIFDDIEVPSGPVTNEDINQSIQDINDNIMDDSPPDDSLISDLYSLLPPGPVDSILSLPLDLFNSLYNSLSPNTCNAIVLPIPYVGGNLTIPCIKTLWNYIPEFMTFYESIGAIIGGVMAYRYLISLYKWVDERLTLAENKYDNWSGL